MENGILGSLSILKNMNAHTALLATKAQEESDSVGGFMIQKLKEITIGGQKVYITTTHVCLLIVTLVIMIFALIVNKKIKNASEDSEPGIIQNIAEIIVEMLGNMVSGIMGKNAKRFVNYITTLFIFVILCNLSGLLGLRPPTADYGVTLPLGLITFGLIQYNAIKQNKFGHFKSMFEPIWFLFPINIIGEFAVPLSLSLRLFGNVMSGTVLMGLIYALVGPYTIGWPAILHAYFDVFSGCIQAYVICMLTMVYITDKIGD